MKYRNVEDGTITETFEINPILPFFILTCFFLNYKVS